MDGWGVMSTAQDVVAALAVPEHRDRETGREIVKDNAGAWRFAGEFGDSLRESWRDESFPCDIEFVERGGGAFLNVHPVPGEKFPYMRPNGIAQERCISGYHHNITVVTGTQANQGLTAQGRADLARVKAYLRTAAGG